MFSQIDSLTCAMCVCVDSKLEVALPDIDYIEIPTTWWDAEADKSLLIGVHKHGEKGVCLHVERLH